MNRYADALLLEDFDIEQMSKDFPDKEIGVNVNRIYIQYAITKYSGVRSDARVILGNKILKLCNEGRYYIEPNYVPMKLSDIMICFGSTLKKLPKSTFILI